MQLNKLLKKENIFLVITVELCFFYITNGYFSYLLYILHFVMFLLIPPVWNDCHFAENILKTIWRIFFPTFDTNFIEICPYGSGWWQVNIASGNGLVLLDNKPLPEPILIKISRIHVGVGHNELTHWVMYMCINNLTIIGSDNSLSPGQRQAIIWTNAGILLIGPLGTNFSEILIEIYSFSFKKMHSKMLSGNGGYFFSASMC